MADELDEVKRVLEKIASGWKYPPGPGMRPPPEPLGRDAMRRLAVEALEYLEQANREKEEKDG